jgi:hypothetical protein
MPTINICTRSARDIRHIQTNSTPLKEKSKKALQTRRSHTLSPSRARMPEQVPGKRFYGDQYGDEKFIESAKF